MLPPKVNSPIDEAWEYLHRYGVINIGFLQKEPIDSVGGNVMKTVIVIGAGVAGLSAARQIRHLWESEGKRVNVFILEGSGRMGGRMYFLISILDIQSYWVLLLIKLILTLVLMLELI